ncbi:hypothetical protein [Thermostichus vulcanus]|uniref:Uncharacterized protein n=1 Tax=Thermostichus vulcanus str. 'Rupite' TaxID=2813851 RepID=A0ABT0CFE5_THEVL|nr:hypothetical protein [Thermostichus vulcanus]MCJ2544506.1 hypothetical protein [Thermostichus vulcanus str. 'Rupite']
MNTLVNKAPIVPILTSGQWMRLESEDGRPVGLIIRRRFMAELVLPGSLVGGPIDARDYVQLIPLGPVRFTYPNQVSVWKQALRQRLQGLSWHGHLLQEPKACRRAAHLWQVLQSHFAPELLKSLDDEVLAQIAGVLPSTFHAIRYPIAARDPLVHASLQRQAS